MQQCLWCPSTFHIYRITFFFQSFPNSPFPLLSCSKIQTSITTTFPKIFAHVILSLVLIPSSFSPFAFPILSLSLQQANFYQYFRIQLKYHLLHKAFPNFLISSQSILCLFLAQQVSKYNSLGFSIFVDMCDHHHYQFQTILFTSKRNPLRFSYHSPYPPIPPPPFSPKEPLSHVLSLQICLLWTLHINATM